MEIPLGVKTVNWIGQRPRFFATFVVDGSDIDEMLPAEAK